MAAAEQRMNLAWLPNVICICRMLLVMPVIWFLIRAEYQLALLLVVIAGASDWLDGFLARQFGWASRIGGLLDPLADKLLFVSVFAALAWNGLVPGWLFAIVLLRDFVIVSGAIAYELLIGPVEPNPSAVGKLNTVVSLVYLFFVIAWQIWGWPPSISVTIAGAGVFVVSLVSGMDYVLTWSRLALRARAS
jgi:cardiolipin synthase